MSKNVFAQIVGPRNAQKSTSRLNFGTFSIPFWIILSREFHWIHPKFLGRSKFEENRFKKKMPIPNFGPNINIIILIGAL